MEHMLIIVISENTCAYLGEALKLAAILSHVHVFAVIMPPDVVKILVPQSSSPLMLGDKCPSKSSDVTEPSIPPSGSCASSQELRKPLCSATW